MLSETKLMNCFGIILYMIIFNVVIENLLFMDNCICVWVGKQKFKNPLSPRKPLGMSEISRCRGLFVKLEYESEAPEGLLKQITGFLIRVCE